MNKIVRATISGIALVLSVVALWFSIQTMKLNQEISHNIQTTQSSTPSSSEDNDSDITYDNTQSNLDTDSQIKKLSESESQESGAHASIITIGQNTWQTIVASDVYSVNKDNTLYQDATSKAFHYFAADNSSIGQQILGLSVGSQVKINNQPYHIISNQKTSDRNGAETFRNTDPNVAIFYARDANNEPSLITAIPE